MEEYLRPIYQSQANYVVVLLSPEYPNRIWTKFESEQFKHRFGEHKVIPIVYNTVVLDLFSLIANTGFVTFNPLADQDNEIARIVKLLSEKIGLLSARPVTMPLSLTSGSN